MTRADAIKRQHSLLVYGAFGTGKTSFLEDIAREVLATGQKARLVTAEHYNTIEDAIEEGLIEVWKVNTRPHPFETLRFAIDGFWPSRELRPGVADPQAPLVAPTQETWLSRPVRFFEGIATLAQYLSGSYAEGGLTQRAESEHIGFEKEYVQFTDGSASVAGMTWTYYRITQCEVNDLINRSQAYPGFQVWTSHEDFSKDKKKIGPEVIGTAANNDIGKLFADVLHIGTVAQDFLDEKTQEVRRIVDRRLYLKEHYTPGVSTPYSAKNSIGKKFQRLVPDYLRMTEMGLPKDDIVKRLFRLWDRDFPQAQPQETK